MHVPLYLELEFFSVFEGLACDYVYLSSHGYDSKI
jgi:hypothetical protein